MKNPEPEKLSVNTLNRAKRKIFSQSQERWIKTEYLQNGNPLPLVDLLLRSFRASRGLVSVTPGAFLY